MPTKLATRPRQSAAETTGLVVRKHGKSGRSYTFNGEKFVSVSNVKDTFPKHLADWGARVERAHVLDALERFLSYLRDNELGQLSPTGVRAGVLAECGEQHAWVKALGEAGNIGTTVHSAIERWYDRRIFEAGDGPDPGPYILEFENEKAQRSFDRFLAWAKDADVLPIAAELSVCSPTHRYGGTFDRLALVQGLPAILDWKSGGNLYLEDRCQVASYIHAYNEFPPAHVRGVEHVEIGYLVHIPKHEDDEVDATIVKMDWPELEQHFSTFMLALPLCYRLRAWRELEKATKAVRA